MSEIKGKAPFSLPDERDPIWCGAWHGALMWAVGEPDILAAFEADTGLRLPKLPTSPIEAMIDNAVDIESAHEPIYIAFVNWFNENVWGVDEMTSPLFRAPQPTGDPQ